MAIKELLLIQFNGICETTLQKFLEHAGTNSCLGLPWASTHALAISPITYWKPLSPSYILCYSFRASSLYTTLIKLVSQPTETALETLMLYLYGHPF